MNGGGFAAPQRDKKPDRRAWALLRPLHRAERASNVRKPRRLLKAPSSIPTAAVLTISAILVERAPISTVQVHDREGGAPTHDGSSSTARLGVFPARQVQHPSTSGAGGRAEAGTHVNDHLGDAYWRVGRQREARFQWTHALTFEPTKDQKPIIQAKLDLGMERAAQLAPANAVTPQ